jgi:Zn-finger nucleic acid-binding protein
MATVDLSSSIGPFLIERCGVCYGLFFDPGELEKVLERGVSNAFVIDYALLEKLAAEQRDRREKVKYVPCPVCGKLMNRVNYGSKSGVVVDRCREHGVWLDAGELKRLFEWTKAGGQMFHQQVSEEKRKIEEQQARRQKGQSIPDMGAEGAEFDLFGTRLPSGPYDFRRHEPGILDVIGDLARFLMKGVK